MAIDFLTEMSLHGSRPELAGQLLAETGVDVGRCYQCGKCSAGCPLAGEMDFPPSVVMRLLQSPFAGGDEKVLRSKAIWLCLNCETCYVRCPMEIDIPRAMDALRHRALAGKKVHPGARKILSFHRAFLDTVRTTGRLYEVGMTVDFKARSRKLFQDLLLAPVMFIKGKLHLIPERIKGRALMKRIFKRTRPEAGK